jgi:hypothetical protein
VHLRTNDSTSEPLQPSLRYGDLPGYSGWMRPRTSLVSYFTWKILLPQSTQSAQSLQGVKPGSAESVDSDRYSDAARSRSQSPFITGQPISIQVTCSGHPDCEYTTESLNTTDGSLNSGALFDVRAYGPAILAGKVTPLHESGIYQVDFVPWDAGVYVIEIVLAASQHPAWSIYPLEAGHHPPCHEGHLLPDFPLTIVVDAAPTMKEVKAGMRSSSSLTAGHSGSTNSSETSSAATSAARYITVLDELYGSSDGSEMPICRSDQLIDYSVDHEWTNARWVVTDVMRQNDYHGVDTRLSLAEYQSAVLSLGFKADYRPFHCRLLSEEQVHSPTTIQQAIERSKMVIGVKDVQVILIGDSNMGLLRDTFVYYFGNNKVTTHYTTVYGGLYPRLPEIRKKLEELKRVKEQRPQTRFYILFNAGLHEIHRTCALYRDPDEPQYDFRPELGTNFSCIEMYKEQLESLVQLVLDFPAELRVWQSTPAAYPRWGNYAGAWPATYCQAVVYSPYMVNILNRIAWSVVAPHAPTIQAIDSYWLTLARPDHRQSDEKNAIGRLSVHAGPEVYIALCRKWAMMILESIASSQGCPEKAFSC